MVSLSSKVLSGHCIALNPDLGRVSQLRKILRIFNQL